MILPDSIFTKGLKTLHILLNEKIHFHFTLGYVAYFVLGYYIHSITLSPGQRKNIYLLGVFGWIFSIFFTRFVSHMIHNNFHFYTDGDVTLHVLFESLAVFVFVKYHIHMLPSKLMRAFSYLAKQVLGIYLVHIGIQSCLRKFFGISGASFNPLISIPLIALFIFILSWITTEGIKRIPLLNKIIL